MKRITLGRRKTDPRPVCVVCGKERYKWNERYCSRECYLAEVRKRTEEKNREMAYQRLKEPGANVHPAVKNLYFEMLAQKVGTREITKRTGVGNITIYRWFHGTRSPRLDILERVYRCLGMTLVAVNDDLILQMRQLINYHDMDMPEEPEEIEEEEEPNPEEDEYPTEEEIEALFKEA